LSATIPPSSNPALLSPSACFSDDHYARIGSPPLELHLDRSVTAANTDSAAGSPTSVAASSSHLTYSPASLQLFANLSSYPL